MERMNELEVFWVGEEPKETQGWRTVLVSESYHPWWSNWWPQGHIIGWEHTFINSVHDLMEAVVNGTEMRPTFRDGLYVQKVLGAVEASNDSRQWEKVL